MNLRVGTRIEVHKNLFIVQLTSYNTVHDVHNFKIMSCSLVVILQTLLRNIPEG